MAIKRRARRLGKARRRADAQPSRAAFGAEGHRPGARAVGTDRPVSRGGARAAASRLRGHARPLSGHSSRCPVPRPVDVQRTCESAAGRYRSCDAARRHRRRFGRVAVGSRGQQPRPVRVVPGGPVRYLGVYVRREFADGRCLGERKWHIDIEDRHTLKVIVYLSDVDDGSGPFEHLDRSATRRAESALRYSSGLVDDDRLARVVERDEWQRVTGPRFTAACWQTRRTCSIEPSRRRRPIGTR